MLSCYPKLRLVRYIYLTIIINFQQIRHILKNSIRLHQTSSRAPLSIELLLKLLHSVYQMINPISLLGINFFQICIVILQGLQFFTACCTSSRWGHGGPNVSECDEHLHLCGLDRCLIRFELILIRDICDSFLKFFELLILTFYRSFIQDQEKE